VCFILIGIAFSVQAQGLLIVEDPSQQVRLPRPILIGPSHPASTPVTSYKIKQLDAEVRLIDQMAQVQVSQTFVNNGSRPLEVAFVFPLPYDGAIDQMTLLVDGKEMPARLLKAEDARRMYEEIVRKNRDPALLEWMGVGLFRTSVFPVPAGASRTVSLRYSQLCRKQEGLTDFIFPLSTAKYTSDAVENINIRVAVESQEEIKNVYSPSHAIEIKRPDDRHAAITFTSKNETPSADFRLLYDVGKGKVSTRVVSYRNDKDQDGYFLLLASPEIQAADQNRPPKTVVFVLDHSGSMTGKKIEQARAALKYVLNNLRKDDLFNIVTFSDQVELFRPELQRYDEDTRKAALGYVEGIFAGGSTNLDGALRMSLSQIQDSKQPSYVIFLTDGLPTVGESNEMKITANAKDSNKVHARLFAFGVGYDVNGRLLDRLARECFGQSEYVRPNEDIEDRVSRLYNRIESPVLTGVQLKFVFNDVKTEEGAPINRVYPKDSFDLFAGEQLVVVGRYRKPGETRVVVQGRVGDKEQTLEFPATLVEKSGDDRFAFIEKLWAVRRVGEILDQIDLNGKNEELVKELIALATQHGILTPYTSFMADERTDLHNVASNMHVAEERLSRLASDSSGISGVAQRSIKGNLQQAINAPAKPTSAPMALKSEMAAVKFGGESSKEDAEQSVRNIGNRTFFRRNNQWVDSQLTKDQQTQAKRVKQFSDEYFELAKAHGRQLSQYLVFDEPVLLNVDNQAYLIEP
jgi:Ca-activated chloride channel family protein